MYHFWILESSSLKEELKYAGLIFLQLSLQKCLPTLIKHAADLIRDKALEF